MKHTDRVRNTKTLAIRKLLGIESQFVPPSCATIANILDAIDADMAEAISALQRLGSDCALILARKPCRNHDETLAEVNAVLSKHTQNKG